MIALATLYAYPADISAQGKEYLPENSNHNIIDVIKKTLKDMSQIDKSISEEFDMVKISLNI